MKNINTSYKLLLGDFTLFFTPVGACAQAAEHRSELQ